MELAWKDGQEGDAKCFYSEGSRAKFRILWKGIAVGAKYKNKIYRFFIGNVPVSDGDILKVELHTKQTLHQGNHD